MQFIPSPRGNNLLAHKIAALIGCALLLLLSSRPTFAQANYGRIEGTVTDQSGGAIAGATVTVTDTQRGVSRALVTDSAGAYSAPNLIPGTYTVRGEFKGFKSIDRQDILLETGKDVRVDLALQPGEQTQTVTVTGEPPAVDTTNAQLSGTIENQAIADLPINGRQYRTLLTLTPGMLATPGTANNKQMGYNNTRPEDLVYLLDGLYSVNPHAGTPTIGGNTAGGGPDQSTILPVDAIQEINVIGNPKAEYGWKPGAQVILGLKSGTNGLHGTAFAFGRDDSFDAKNPFLSPTQSKAAEELEQFGGSIGGPIKKDKLFYFGSYEGQRFLVGTPKQIQEPAALAGAGTASSFPDAIADMNARHVTISPLSLNLAGCTNNGSTAGANISCNAANGLFGNSTSNPAKTIALNTWGGSDNVIAKLDYHRSDHHTFNGEYYFGNGSMLYSSSAITKYWEVQDPTQVHVGRGIWVWTPNSTWVNEARFGYDNSALLGYIGECVENLGQPNYSSQFGFVSGVEKSTLGVAHGYCGFPVLTVTGFTALGGPTNPSVTRYGTYDFLDNVSFTHGKHQFKFGGEIRKTNVSTATFTNGRGTLTFNTAVNAFTGATALENFLAGDPATANVLLGDSLVYLNFKAYSLFVQDDWSLTRRITVNLGLRWEGDTPVREATNRVGGFDPTVPTGLYQQNGSQSAYNADYNNFAPRLGIAWDVTGKGTTVVRAGGGISYETTPNMLSLVNSANINSVPTGFTLFAPNGTSQPGPGTIQSGTLGLSNPQSAIPWAVNTPVFNATPSALSCGNGLGRVNPSAATGAANPANPPVCNIAPFVRNFREAYVTTWTFGIQHAFTNSLSLTASYVGNHGTLLDGNIDINQPTPGAKNAATNPQQLRRPFYGQFPYLGKILVYNDGQESNYHALQAVLTQRVAHGFTYNVFYTYSHGLEEGPFNTATNQPADSRHPELEYGNSSFDARHHLNITGSYTLPGVKAPAQLLQGWQVHTAVQIQTALPFVANDTTDDVSGTGELLDRWNLAGDSSDFNGFGQHASVPCFGAAGSTFARAGCSTAVPAACSTAAAAEPSGPGGTTGTAQLAAIGCYMVNGSVIVPPSQGTFGSMRRNVLRGAPFYQWDLSVDKLWKFNERVSAQFRAEAFNILNRTNYALPTANLGAPATFGQSQSTPDSVNPVIGTGGARRIQFGLKFTF